MSNPNNQCMGCMNPLPEGRGECGICGYPAGGENPPLYLPVRTLLSERYLVGRLLEAEGDAAVYLGYDQVLKAPIRIREFLPDTLCERAPDGSLQVLGGCESTYRDYCEKFRSHARALARMRELTAVVAVYDIFEQNNTAYTISEYCEGNTLEARLALAGGRMRWEDVRPLFMPLMASLISLHAAGIFHLGISPLTIVVGNDGRLHLQDFCIEDARRVSSDLRPKLAPGYSAPEQYALGQETGARSDVYGLAATIFRVLTGNPPPEGAQRAKDSNDLYVPSDVAAQLPDYVAAALFNALQVNPANRTASVERFRDQLSTAPAVSALREDESRREKTAAMKAEQEPPAPQKKKKKSNAKIAVLIVLAVFILLLLLAGTVLLLLFPDALSSKGGEESSGETSTVIVTDPIVTQPTEPAGPPQYAAEDLKGRNYFEIKDDTFNGGMTIELEGMIYSDRPRGEILSQTPGAENMADINSVIKVIISAGPETKQVPDVTGWNYDHAKLYLEALGFTVKRSDIVSEVYDFNIVESGDVTGESLPEGSTVVLRVSISQINAGTNGDADIPTP